MGKTKIKKEITTKDLLLVVVICLTTIIACFTMLNYERGYKNAAENCNVIIDELVEDCPMFKESTIVPIYEEDMGMVDYELYIELDEKVIKDEEN